ncbi:sulfite oxidase [Neobacillus kokaensis]|uniref:Sulfite oxidase n=1 Tax=Neobacillus kokaensis TaxID=2759023 RepID=A0ABQ3N6A2_9BACI|nr:sulfite oxidase [Neobacillus kokaensis]GHH99018.1 sulfite oxidase [Neobacillus kokaensis]
MARYPFSSGKPSLIVRKVHPDNRESPLQFIENDTIGNDLFYRRNHFSYPALPQSSYWLPVNGLVHRPSIFTLDEIIKMPSKTLKVILECAGNKRHFFEPKVFGDQWEKGAMSQGYWKGVPLRNLLELAGGVKPGAKEVLIEGYDFGKQPNMNQPETFARSLPLNKALHPDTLIAYQYNNQPIPFKHGYPLRLIVPQWYAVASVKWIKQISVIDYKFNGSFQADDYVYYPKKESDAGAFRVTTINVNSSILNPLNREILDTGKHLIKGIAWTGEGAITKVEVSTDNGTNWSTAKLTVQRNQERYAWTTWSYEWNPDEKGEYTILTRAADSLQRIQPKVPFWNRKGYGYNAIDQIKVKIE